MSNEIQDQREALEKELRDTLNDLACWEDRDLNRGDGSGAQDARHEEIGRSLRARVQVLTDKLAKV